MTALLLAVFGLALIGWLAGHARALAFTASRGVLPRQQGWYVAVWTGLPALALLLCWAMMRPADEITLPAMLALLLALVGGGLAFARLRPGFAAGKRVERIVVAALFAASMVAIVTTAGILLSLLWEGGRFFAIVPAGEFLFGTHWSPQTIEGGDPTAGMGALPLFWGSFFIGAVIAMGVAVPLGLLSAIYLSHYAAPRTRRWAKPALEVLAGIPTVVYGYLAAVTVAPAIRDLGVALGIGAASSESALAAGLVMGVMIIPFVSSTADDALSAVPRTLAEASLALGATPSETVRHVLLPTALPGIAGGVLLAVSRAVGETMIVVMAASSVATISANPFAPATTVTRQIVDLLTGEATFDSAKTLAAFALGLVLFLLTLFLNFVALAAMRRRGAARA
ncbi:phosphate ABC transporter permease subunit PstC [Sphingomonas rubra]|uniref:Phosphate transport system permease protein n=1 Tax=Sphingomonas rubra TaxID=634430 RepID=A0A1I5QQH0_9SPHN|nr:phosphate ABC transporter permease subunit PstC [Sphingomonas rubra]SFP48317.1 phosphate ABC transporter, permease protein PstC [Sphingomonas rubra]